MASIIACTGCGSKLRIREEYLGRAIKCPKCGQTLQPGALDNGEVPAPSPELSPIREAPAAPRPVMLQPANDDIPEVRPKQPRRRDDGDDDLDVRRRPVSGGYVPCPSCGNTDAQRVLFTFWGSFHVTNMVCHVQCSSCGTRYNGRTGRSNLPVAILCVTIPLLLILAIIGTLTWWILVNSRGTSKKKAELAPPAVVLLSSQRHRSASDCASGTSPGCWGFNPCTMSIGSQVVRTHQATRGEV